MQFDWKNIDTVLLDMDGTLLDLHFDSYFWLTYLPQVWADSNGLMLDDAKDRINRIMVEHAGTLNWYCVHFWNEALEVDIMQLKSHCAHKIGYRPTAEAFLERCLKECDDVRMVTNAHREILNLKIVKTNIDQYFHQLLCSHELNHPKEDPQFWVLLNENKSFDPERTLFIDDSEAVLDSAAQHGIKHLYSIAQPDSSMTRATVSRFPMLERLA
jgi:putative hydrolase of the HAD superfamily